MENNELARNNKQYLNMPITSNLVVADIYNKTSINKQNKEIIIASRCYPKIKDMDGQMKDCDGKLRELRKVEIEEHINLAIFNSGFTGGNDEDVNMLIIKIRDYVLSRYDTLTTQEVGIAFRNGSIGVYGEYIGLSPRIFFYWLHSYCEQCKIEANKELIKLDAPKVDAEPSEEEKQKRFNTWLTTFYNDFNSFVKTDEYNIYDTDNMFYHFLQKEQLIPKLSDVKKAAILKKAKEVVKAQYQPEDNANVFQKNEYKRFIERIKNKDKGVQYEITAEAKRIHLKLFLTSLKKKNVDLKNLIEKKSN